VPELVQEDAGEEQQSAEQSERIRRGQLIGRLRFRVVS